MRLSEDEVRTAQEIDAEIERRVVFPLFKNNKVKKRYNRNVVQRN